MRVHGRGMFDRPARRWRHRHCAPYRRRTDRPIQSADHAGRAGREPRFAHTRDSVTLLADTCLVGATRISTGVAGRFRRQGERSRDRQSCAENRLFLGFALSGAAQDAQSKRRNRQLAAQLCRLVRSCSRTANGRASRELVTIEAHVGQQDHTVPLGEPARALRDPTCRHFGPAARICRTRRCGRRHAEARGHERPFGRDSSCGAPVAPSSDGARWRGLGRSLGATSPDSIRATAATSVAPNSHPTVVCGVRAQLPHATVLRDV